jgi:hypothetical protein
VINRFWVKDWICSLDDSRIATLPDSTWRVAKECTLVAGEYGTKQGYLPPLPELAFRLRRQEGELAPHLETLVEVDYLVSLKRGLRVKNWEKRQSAVPALERKRAQRKAETRVGVTNCAGRVTASDTTGDQREREKTDRIQREGGKNKRPPTNKRARYL